MKGIVLAGGSGTRLYPITKGLSKQLIPVYDKPMIYYPISVLMMAGIKEILIISTPDDLPGFKKLLGSGEQLGISFDYEEQPSPDGLAQAFLIGETFIGGDDVCLILGDNLLYGNGILKLLQTTKDWVTQTRKARIFGYHVKDPKQYGVAEFDSNGKVISIEEKPKFPRSNYAVIGLYFYPNSVVKIAKKIKPSTRGELEITSINEEYLKKEKLEINVLGRGYAWFDTGTHQSLFEAGEFIRSLQERQDLQIACLEEIAFSQNYISKEDLLKLVEKNNKSSYGKYIQNIVTKI